MVASDGGVPALIDTTVVYFNVTRNLAAPEFIPTVYAATLSEDRAVGNPFTTVTARDADITVSPASPNAFVSLIASRFNSVGCLRP